MVKHLPTEWENRTANIAAFTSSRYIDVLRLVLEVWHSIAPNDHRATRHIRNGTMRTYSSEPSDHPHNVHLAPT